jgi:glycerol-3-phosphate dehydrogenase
VPFSKKFTLIGTTDVPFNGDLTHISIEPSEIAYLCDIVNEYFRHPLKPEHIVHTWSGVRPLVHEDKKDPSENTREYKLELETEGTNLPLLTVYGGKLTAYRAIAEKAIDKLKPYFPACGEHWTAKFPLPGGDLPEQSVTVFLERIAEQYEWLPSQLALRYAKSYGTLTYTLLNHARNIESLGRHFGQGLYEREVTYLIQKEWARTTEDILWRRTRLGLVFSHAQKEALDTWLEENRMLFTSKQAQVTS